MDLLSRGVTHPAAVQPTGAPSPTKPRSMPSVASARPKPTRSATASIPQHVRVETVPSGDTDYEDTLSHMSIVENGSAPQPSH